MKIYTKSGDDGTTGVIGAGRVSKASPVIDVVGSLDELNAHLGALQCVAHHELVFQAQNLLFEMGAECAATSQKKDQYRMSTTSFVSELEASIDEMESELPTLTNFILPGGCNAAVQCHITRSVCRRAERAVVSLSAIESVRPILLETLNRLSDWLFVYARYLNQKVGIEESKWVQPS